MKDITYDVLDISRYIINRCNDEGVIISNLKLQKLLYFVQGYTLAFNHYQCFKDEIQAWDYGPVCPSAYHEYKQFGANNIPPISQYEEITYTDGVIKWNCKTFNSSCIDVETKEIIDAVIDIYGKFSATELVEITHSQEPWEIAYKDNDGKKNISIDISLLERYFSRIIGNVNE